MNKTNPKTETGEGNAPHIHHFAGQHMPILTCTGVNRRQAFRLGSHFIGYGETDQDAIENLISKEAI